LKNCMTLKLAGWEKKNLPNLDNSLVCSLNTCYQSPHWLLRGCLSFAHDVTECRSLVEFCFGQWLWDSISRSKAFYLKNSFVVLGELGCFPSLAVVVQDRKWAL
jgi:hypothetical protein